MAKILSLSYSVGRMNRQLQERNTGVLRFAQNDTARKTPLLLTELFSESPNAERDQREREEEQGQEVRPDVREPASLEHGSADDGCEMVDGIKHSERLQPFRHCLDRIERSGQGGERRVDKKAGELRLLRRLAERGDDRSDADSGQDAQGAGAKQKQQAAMERDSEDELDDADGHEHHQGQQQEERGDLGDDDFGGACGRHEELLDGSGFAFANHSRGCDKGTVKDQQQAENAGDDEPRIDQAGVEEKRWLELDLTAVGEV